MLPRLCVPNCTGNCSGAFIGSVSVNVAARSWTTDRCRRAATRTGTANARGTSEGLHRLAGGPDVLSGTLICVAGRGRCKDVTTAEVAGVAELAAPSFRPAAPAADSRCAYTKLPCALPNGHGVLNARPLPKRLAGGEIKYWFAAPPGRVTQQRRRTALDKPPAPQTDRGGTIPSAVATVFTPSPSASIRTMRLRNTTRAASVWLLDHVKSNARSLADIDRPQFRLAGDAVICEMHASRSGASNNEVRKREDSWSPSGRLSQVSLAVSRVLKMRAIAAR